MTMNRKQRIHLRMNRERSLLTNKKGDVATIMLFAVTLLLVISALFYFYAFNRNFSTAFQGFNYMSNEAEFAETYIRVESALIAKESALDKRVADRETRSYFIATDVFSGNAGKRDLKYTGVGNYFLKARSTEYTFNKMNCSGKIEFVLEIKGITYTINKKDDLGDGRFNENTLSRTFDICNVYDSAGGLMNGKCESAAKVMTDCGIRAI